MMDLLSVLCDFNLLFFVILPSRKASSFGIVFYVIVGCVLILNIVFGLHR